MIERPPRRRPSRKPKRVRKTKGPQVTIKYVSLAPSHLTSSEKIAWALGTIASEVKSNGGNYPYSKSRPNIQEVLRRAAASTPIILSARVTLNWRTFDVRILRQRSKLACPRSTA